MPDRFGPGGSTGGEDAQTLVKGKSRGATTIADGRFRLSEAEAGEVLIFSPRSATPIRL